MASCKNSDNRIQIMSTAAPPSSTARLSLLLPLVQVTLFITKMSLLPSTATALILNYTTRVRRTHLNSAYHHQYCLIFYHCNFETPTPSRLLLLNKGLQYKDNLPPLARALALPIQIFQYAICCLNVWYSAHYHSFNCIYYAGMAGSICSVR